MRLAITGATGFVGSLLVPKLIDAGVDLVLVGREPSIITAKFGEDVPAFSYDALDAAFQNVDAVLHLAVLNTGAAASEAEFAAVNVTLLEQVLEACKQSNVKQLVYTGTFHTERASHSPYAASKRQAEALLNDEYLDFQTTVLALPAVYGDDLYAGKLAALYKLPKFARRPAFHFLGAFRPTVHIDHVFSAFVRTLNEGADAPDHLHVSDRQLNNPVYRAFQRFVDLAFSIAVAGLFFWLLAATWLAVRLTSKGPGLFVQERVGKGGTTFNCIKFRTMQTNTKIAGTHEVSANSVTPIGKALRKFKLDELPQIWNLVRGEMSLVGPRPCLPVQTEVINARKALDVDQARPGITGLSQISDIDMSDPERLARSDAQYLATRTVQGDVKIILKTFFGAGRADRVAER